MVTKEGHTDIVHLLLAARAQLLPNARFGKERAEKTLLFHAASRGHVDLVHLLLAEKADVGLADKNDETPLFRSPSGTLSCFFGSRFPFQASSHQKGYPLYDMATKVPSLRPGPRQHRAAPSSGHGGPEHTRQMLWGPKWVVL